MRVGIAQINPTVGDISGNCARIAEAVRAALAQRADLVLVPEMAVLGYPPRDLVNLEGMVPRCEEMVAVLAADVCRSDALVVIGSPRRNPSTSGHGVFNSAALCRRGVIESWYDKQLLPTYDVFDEDRYFDEGDRTVIAPAAFPVGITICEDWWTDEAVLKRRLYDVDPALEAVKAGARLIVNISASPFVLGKPAFRRELFSRLARRAAVPLIYANAVGANDDLIFDGRSLLIAPDGRVVHECAAFHEDLVVLDLEETLARPALPETSERIRDLFDALVLGLADYIRKCGFAQCLLGLSGGIDSALVACLACAAWKNHDCARRIRGLALPSRYSSQGSVDDARELARRLGIRFEVVPIEPAHRTMMDMLAPHLSPAGAGSITLAEENLQARLRGNILMTLSNDTGALLLTTGNKSELAVGYCTLYGDMAGGLAVISDVPKTSVYALSRWINANAASLGFREPPIPQSTLDKAPSAELRPNQTDQDSLPPYDVLDEIIRRYVEHAQSRARITAETGFSADVVNAICRRIDANEYKRQQMPVGLKVSTRAFGSGWRMPIATKWG